MFINIAIPTPTQKYIKYLFVPKYPLESSNY